LTLKIWNLWSRSLLEFSHIKWPFCP